MCTKKTPQLINIFMLIAGHFFLICCIELKDMKTSLHLFLFTLLIWQLKDF